jgi:hypothetical protein
MPKDFNAKHIKIARDSLGTALESIYALPDSFERNTMIKHTKTVKIELNSLERKLNRRKSDG